MPREDTVYCEYSPSGPRSAQGRDLEDCVPSFSNVRARSTPRVGTVMCPAHAMKLPWEELPDDGLTICEGYRGQKKHLTSVKHRDTGQKCKLIDLGDGGIHSILGKRFEDAKGDSQALFSSQQSAQSLNTGPTILPTVTQPDSYPEHASPQQSHFAPTHPLSSTGSASHQDTNSEQPASQHQLPNFEDFLSNAFAQKPKIWGGPSPTQ